MEPFDILLLYLESTKAGVPLYKQQKSSGTSTDNSDVSSATAQILKIINSSAFLFYVVIHISPGAVIRPVLSKLSTISEQYIFSLSALLQLHSNPLMFSFSALLQDSSLSSTRPTLSVRGSIDPWKTVSSHWNAIPGCLYIVTVRMISTVPHQ